MNGDRFLDNFIGEKITITTISQHTTNLHDENGMLSDTSPIFYEGYLCDVDDNFVYLGETPHEVNQAVKLNHILHVIVLSEVTIADAILNQMPPPATEDEVN